jgi:pectate lyase
MSVRARSATLAILALLAAASLPAYAATDPALEAAPSDGWAAMAGGTTGGSTATSDQVYSVTNRLQLLSAMATGGTRPKIIKIVGTIDMSEGVPFTDKADQDRRAQVRPPSNTTLIGAGPGAGLVNGRIDIIGVSNVIVRNLKIVAPCDIAPVFDPTDGVGGSWNAAYDGIGIQGAEHIWIDHNTITDVPTTDDTLPIENGKPKQCHDGAVDITRGANYVSVTYNVFDRHDKTMLIGHSDSNTADIGRLKVTISNNVFTAITQRAPRLRFGQVHVFNNYHVGSKTAPVYAHSYSTGIGIGGQVISTANVFECGSDVESQCGQRFRRYGIGAQRRGARLMSGEQRGQLDDSVRVHPPSDGARQNERASEGRRRQIEHKRYRYRQYCCSARHFAAGKGCGRRAH